MAITLRGVGTKVNGTSSVASLAQPTGSVAGDVLLAFIVDHATSGNSAAPSGWQYRGGAAGSAGRLQVFSAVVGTNGLTGTSWTFSGLTTRSMGQILGYYNVDQTGYGGLDVAISARINAATVTGTTGISTAADGAMVVAAFCALAGGNTWSAEACATNPTLAEEADSTNSSYCSLALADGLMAAAGPTGDSSATMSGTAVANGGVLVALKPLAVTGTLAGTLGNVSAAVAGLARAEGALAGTLANVTGSLAGTAGSGGGSAEFGYHPTIPGSLYGDYWNDASLNVVSSSNSANPASSGKLQSISVACFAGTGTTELYTAIYSDNSGSPGTLLGQSAGSTTVTTTPGYYTVDMTSANVDIVAGTPYWLGFYSSVGVNWYYLGSVTNALQCDSTHKGSWQATWGSTAQYNEQVAMYATYSTSSGVTGALGGTLAAVTGALVGAHGVAGTEAGTLANITGAVAGTVRGEGSLAGMLAAVTGAISGTPGVAGTVAGNLANITGAVVGAHGVMGALAANLTAVIGTINGTASGPDAVTGMLVGNLAAITGVISGIHGVAGNLSGNLSALTGNVTVLVRVAGALAGTLTNIFGSVSGFHGVAGQITGNLTAITGYVSGQHGVAGVMAGTLTPITASMIGLVVVTGSLTRTLQPVTAVFVGTAGPDTIARWKFPALFSASGFSYGDYDPGQTAAIAIGCLHLYMKTGDSRANTWARRILDDLRVNRQSPTYPYLYKSDLHHGWLNALVAQAFGLAVTGRPGQAYAFASTQEDRDHFLNMVNQFFIMAGDGKPNVLNADLIPFSYVEAVSSWEYAPNYIMNQQMGSLEALVLMLEVALAYARLQSDWGWFNRLLAFILRDNLVVLNQAQIRTITAACDQAGAANLVRLRYADYDRDSSNYCEARDQGAIDNWGEQALDLDLRYGSPVILEDPAAAQLLATRMLQRLAPPQEAVEVETWLEGVRIELGDTAAVSSDFHGWDREEFTVLGRDLDLGHRRVRLKLSRLLDRSDPFAVDAGGSASDAWAIDQASSWDENWDSRAYVY